MKALRLIILLSLGLFLITAVPALRASETGPEATVVKARAYILDPNFSPDGIEKVLVEVLDASLAILPQKDYAPEFKSRIDWVKASFAEKHLFSDKIRQYLGLAYKLVANGTSWQLPEELKSISSSQDGMKAAIKVCARFLESAAAEMKAGNNEKAVRHILDFVIMVVTPVEA
jgi:hypothetical protein